MQRCSVGVCAGGKHSLTAWAADRPAFCTAFPDCITPGVLPAHRLSEMWGALPRVSAVTAGSTADLEVLAGAPYLSYSRAVIHVGTIMGFPFASASA